jgi:hypothetical protein
MAKAAPLQPGSIQAPPRGLTEYLKDALLEACKEATRPLVRLCIKHGISFRELTDAIRYVFVESAKDDYLRDDQPTSSRIAALSGLTRADVERIQHSEAESKSVTARMNASIQVLSAWHSDPVFTGPYGIPLDLPLQGASGFQGLADRYADGFPTDEVLDDLVRSGCVGRGKGNTIKVLRRSYLSGNIDPAVISYTGRSLRTLAETLEFNIEKPDSKDKRFQRQFMSTQGIRESDLPAFNELLREAGQKFLEDLDAWTTEREKALKNLEKTPNEIPRVYPGVGIYMFFYQGPVKRNRSE